MKLPIVLLSWCDLKGNPRSNKGLKLVKNGENGKSNELIVANHELPLSRRRALVVGIVGAGGKAISIPLHWSFEWQSKRIVI